MERVERVERVEKKEKKEKKERMKSMKHGTAMKRNRTARMSDTARVVKAKSSSFTSLTSLTSRTSVTIPPHAHALTAIALIALAACTSAPAPPPDATAFTLSDTMLHRIGLDTVKLLPVESVIELNGRIAPDDNRLANVYPIVGGQVLQVPVELGDRVTKGQTLAVIRSSEVADLERRMINARSEHEVAVKNLATKQDLFDSQLLSERKLVEARHDLEKARAKLRRMEEIFSIYRFQEGSQYVVQAPISGYVIQKDIMRDITLPEGHAEPVFTIAELDEVWALAEVYESDIARVQEGLPAEIVTLSYPDRVFPGTVDKIFNILDPRTRTMRIRVKLQNPEVLLKPEMIARVRLAVHEDRRLPAIPAKALINDHGKHYVMTFMDRYNIGTRQVTPLRTTSSSTWIAEGLQPGEVIIGREQLFVYDALNDQ